MLLFQADKTNGCEPLRRHRRVSLRRAGEVPLALSRERDRPSRMLGNATTHQIRSKRVDTFALLESYRAKATTNPRVKLPIHALTVSKSEISSPAAKEGSQFHCNLFHRPWCSTLRCVTKLLLQTSQTFRSHDGTAIGEQAVAEKLSFLNWRCRTLGRVYLQAQSFGEPRGDAREHPRGCR